MNLHGLRNGHVATSNPSPNVMQVPVHHSSAEVTHESATESCGRSKQQHRGGIKRGSQTRTSYEPELSASHKMHN
jgi:hypothetical protein